MNGLSTKLIPTRLEPFFEVEKYTISTSHEDVTNHLGIDNPTFP